VVEGRFLFDCFVLNEKLNAIYYHGSQAVLGTLDVRTAATDVGKTTIYVNGTPADATNVYLYKLGTGKAAVAYNDSLAAGTDSWVSLSSNPLEVGSLSTNTWVTVAEVTSAGKAVAVGSAIINQG